MAELKVTQSSYKKMQGLAKYKLFDSVRVYPDRVSFDGQDKNETIILFLRQHPIILIPPLVYAIGVFLLFIFFAWIFGTLFSATANISTIGFVLFICGFAFSISMFLYSFLKWYFTVNIVTSSRLVDLDFETVTNSRWSTTVLRAIQDVSYSTPGFINALFDMANLIILTASHKEHFELSNVPKARDVQDVIMDLVENEKQNAPNNGLN